MITFGMSQFAPPPRRNRAPRFLRSEKVGILGSKVIFAFPCCLFVGVVRPLHLEELDGLVAGATFSLVKNTDRMLMIGEVFLKIDRFVINWTAWVFEALLELGHLKDIVHPG